MKRATAELTVGVLVLLAGLALLFLALRVSGLLNEFQDEKGYTVTAYFQNVTGLNSRAKVTMSGVTIGQVESIQLDPQRYDAAVKLNLYNNMRSISKDANASIQTNGILGEKYIAISQGADAEYLKNGDIIDISQTQSSLVLEDLISKFLFNKATAPTPAATTAASPAPASNTTPGF